ncbi:LOW QUALITY PROTEIN: hypothetical protein CVT25_009238 [Psilocybe cyanescens]|uniref:G-protein coupled receptors family 1 profile domain-containing protein n=1 Tax=Psilocybe cyanescens TaxID=93625 RepID=A0A409XTN1_PSICY|nr:LOW QUALITY PROTEIN: hypothetical protein CVT25_009238 [Psilocybe cyanescens]
MFLARNAGISIAEQETVIGSVLNSIILLTFFVGVYTVFNPNRLLRNNLLAVSKKTADTNRSIVLPAISILFLLSAGTFVIQWFLINLAVVYMGRTRESIFITMLSGAPTWMADVMKISFYATFIVSDGLLVTCDINLNRNFPFHECDLEMHASLGSIVAHTLCSTDVFPGTIGNVVYDIYSTPIHILHCVSGLFAAIVVTQFLFSGASATTHATLTNNVRTAQMFVSVATTLTTTLLIAYKIHVTSRRVISSSKQAFKHIVIVLLESAAVYSIVILAFAIVIAIPSLDDVLSSSVAAYMEQVVTFTAGMAPTVLVARLALTSPRDKSASTTAFMLSGIQFQAQKSISQDIIDISEGICTVMTGSLKDDLESQSKMNG